MQNLALGSRRHLPLVPCKKAGEKKEIQIMYQNRISLIGFVGNAVQLKSTKNGTPVAVLSVATESSWKNGKGKGEYDSRTEWHRCNAGGKLAEFAGKLEKGAHVQIEGELRYGEYKKGRGSDANAAPAKRGLAEIHANRILQLDRPASRTSLLPNPIKRNSQSKNRLPEFNGIWPQPSGLRPICCRRPRVQSRRGRCGDFHDASQRNRIRTSTSSRRANNDHRRCQRNL